MLTLTPNKVCQHTDTPVLCGHATGGGISGRHAMGEMFRKFAIRFAAALGTPLAFTLALATVLVWVITGPLFDFSAAWQLVINTGTTIVTFLMVFLIQTTQNRDMQVL